MTTIACNKESLYGDLQMTNGTYKFKSNGKVFRFKAGDYWQVGFIVGFAGTANGMFDVKEFFANPNGPRPRVKDISGLVLTEGGDIFRFDHYLKWHSVDVPYCAIGSGQDFAMGAMALGASPKEAVKIAMKHDIYTGMGVKGYAIHQR